MKMFQSEASPIVSKAVARYQKRSLRFSLPLVSFCFCCSEGVKIVWRLRLLKKKLRKSFLRRPIPRNTTSIFVIRDPAVQNFHYVDNSTAHHLLTFSPSLNLFPPFPRVVITEPYNPKGTIMHPIPFKKKKMYPVMYFAVMNVRVKSAPLFLVFQQEKQT